MSQTERLHRQYPAAMVNLTNRCTPSCRHCFISTDFIWNKTRALELTRSENAPAVTANCPSRQLVLPLYLADVEFVIPFCCHGKDVDCDLFGSRVVFHLAARLENEK